MEKLQAILSLIFGFYFLLRYKSAGERGVRSLDRVFRRRPPVTESQQVATSQAIAFFCGLVIFIYGLILGYKVFLADVVH